MHERVDWTAVVLGGLLGGAFFLVTMLIVYLAL